MPIEPALSSIAATIQSAIAPVFLLAGIGAILNVLTGRLARVVDRARAVEQLHPVSTGPEHDRHVWELRRIDKRITVINWALLLVTLSAVLVCLVVALLFLGELIQLRIGTVIAGAFIASMACVTAGLVCFLAEVQLSLKAMHIRAELLERDSPR